MYFVVDGLILIFDDGDEDVLAMQEKHSHFGEQGLLDVNEGRRTAGAKAAEDTKLIKISGELIRSMLRHQAQLVERSKGSAPSNKKLTATHASYSYCFVLNGHGPLSL